MTKLVTKHIWTARFWAMVILRFTPRSNCMMHITNATRYYAALLRRRGPHIASHSVCLSVCPSVCQSVPFAEVVLLFLFTFFTVEPSYERTSKIEKLLFSLMGQRNVCTFRHAQRAAYRTAISAAKTCCYSWCYCYSTFIFSLRLKAFEKYKNFTSNFLLRAMWYYHRH